MRIAFQISFVNAKTLSRVPTGFGRRRMLKLLILLNTAPKNRAILGCFFAYETKTKVQGDKHN